MKTALDSSVIPYVITNDPVWPSASEAELKSTRESAVNTGVMKRAGLRDVFGFDRHFESAGFRLWPVR